MGGSLSLVGQPLPKRVPLLSLEVLELTPAAY
jgi:hypothetical protein